MSISNTNHPELTTLSVHRDSSVARRSPSKNDVTCAAFLARCFVIVMCCTLLSGCNIDGLFKEPAMQQQHVDMNAGSDNGQSPRPAAPEEMDLVEDLLTRRAQYHRALERLRAYYLARGHETKLTWADYELNGLRKVKTFRYVLDAEIPPESLRPVDDIEEANLLYDRAQDLMRRGGHQVPGIFRRDIMVQASHLLDELIKRYPSSDKIDDAAFLQGEIHKEYLTGLETLAVKWYERAWTWNPTTPHPARFQAAVVYDFRLHDRDRALELYQAVIRDEPDNLSNARFSATRIEHLSRDLSTARADAR